MSEEKRVLHCWADRGEIEPEWRQNVYLVNDAEPGYTCMLEDGHEGPHEWTSDREIGVSFSGPSTPGKAE